MIAKQIAEERAAVAREAGTWLGTKFHDHAAVKGAGVDCVHLPASVFETAIRAIIPIPDYPAQWHLQSPEVSEDGERNFRERYLEGLIAAGFVEISNEREDVEPYDPEHFIKTKVGTGDLVLSRIGRVFCHGAIVINWPQIVHAESSPCGTGRVEQKSLEYSWFFQGRDKKVFSWKLWH